MLLTQNAFLATAGDRNVVWINPAKVEYSTGTKWPVGRHKLGQLNRILPTPIVNLFKAAIKHREPFLIPSKHFGTEAQVAQTVRYKKVIDFIQNKENVSQSLWYQDLLQALNQNGIAHHKNIQMHSDADIQLFLRDYVGGLVNSMQTNGYKDPNSGYESTAVINQKGVICKSGSGNHRFCISKALNLDRFPLRIVGIHENWPMVEKLRPGLTAESIINLLPEIEARHR